MEKLKPCSFCDAALARAEKAERDRDNWKATAAERFDWWRKSQDALYALSYPDVDADLLLAIADFIDCQPGCDYGYTECDTNTFVCKRCEEEVDCWANAEHLRALAKALTERKAGVATEITAFRETLAGSDASSLPDDMSVPGMAVCRMSDLEAARAEVARLQDVIESAYGDLWRDTRQHSGLIASARTTLLRAITHDQQRRAVQSAYQRHGPVSDHEILHMGCPTGAALNKEDERP